MQLTFLKAEVPLTKKFEKRSDGSFVGGAYPGVTNFTSHVEEVSSSAEFAERLKHHAATGHCLLTNSLTRPIKNESRAKLSNKNERREWILLDVDGLADVTSVEDFVMRVLPSQFHNVSYIAQYSPSHGIKAGIRAHVYFLLNDLVDVRAVEAWLVDLNLSHAILSNSVTLSASNLALSYPLDRVASRNGRIIYITAPECVGFEDPVPERITHVAKGYDRVSFPFASITPTEIAQRVRDKVNELRAAKSLPISRKKDHIRTNEHGQEFLHDDLVEPGYISSWEEDNDRFMRCNINGGDSFAYYYHRDQEDPYLHNFKGEPSIKLRLFDPAYYREHVVPHFEEMAKTMPRPFVFRDRATDKYFAGTRRGDEVLEQPEVIGSDKKIGDYFVQKGLTSPPAVIETWDRVFDPTLMEQYNEDALVFNTWRPTEYQKNTLYCSRIPDTIAKIIHHVTGNDDETFEHFINWVAYIQQYRTKTGTAWVLHGVPGTGKGLLFHHILRPIFGPDYCAVKQIKDLTDRFNGWMEQTILCNVDEANAEDLSYDSKEIVNALKNWITEPYQNVRHMQAVAKQCRSWINFVFTTNDFGILPIQEGDRRFNVAPRQLTKLEITPEEVAQIDEELASFSAYLMHYKVDVQMAHRPLDNWAKLELQQAARSSIEEFFFALGHGDLEYFIEGTHEDSSEYTQLNIFKEAVAEWIEDAKAERPSQVTLPQLKAAHIVMCREKGMKGAAFRSMCAKRGHPVKQMRVGEDRWRGWEVEWKQTPDLKRTLKTHLKLVPSQADLEKKVNDEISRKPT